MAHSVDTETTKGSFDSWTIDEVKQWVLSWKTPPHGVPQSVIDNLTSVIDLYQINGMTLLYLAKDDLLEFGLSSSDISITMQRLEHLLKYPEQALQANQSAPQPEIQSEEKNDDDNTTNSSTNSSTSKGHDKLSYTEGYLATKGQEVFLCLQKGDEYTKLSVDASSTIYELKLQYIAKRKENGDDSLSVDQIVLLFMSRALSDSKTLIDCNIGCNNVTIIYVAERMKRASPASTSTSSTDMPKATTSGLPAPAVISSAPAVGVAAAVVGPAVVGVAVVGAAVVGGSAIVRAAYNVVKYALCASPASTSTSTSGEEAGILFINKADHSEHILYVDTSISFAELKQLYKRYLVSQLERRIMTQEAQIVAQQSITFEISGCKFKDEQLLKDCGVGVTELQYIFVDVGGSMSEEEKDNDDEYVTKFYQMTPKEHKHVHSVKEAFEKSIVQAKTFQENMQSIIQTIKTTSKHELDQMSCYPKIEDIVKEQTSAENKKATAYTKQVLNTAANGKLGEDLNTTLHVINHIFRANGDECLFYDSRKGVKLSAGDSAVAMHEAFQKEKPFVLRLKTLDGLYGASSDDVKEDTHKLAEMQAAIDNNLEHPTLAHVKQKLSAALGITPERLNIVQVFAGSDCFKYTVLNLTFQEKNAMIQRDPTRRLAQQFQQFSELKIHPLLFRPAFDVAQFDKRGNKSFLNGGNTFEVGPQDQKRTYTQPQGWTRYGLSVLGKYGDDKWLHPFQDPGNWWRAFHGTKNASRYIQNQAPPDAAAQAMADVHNNGFMPAQVAAYGAGTYCSPKPTTAEGYAAKIKMNIRGDNGGAGVQEKEFKFMLQVAVKPGPNTLTARSDDNVWSVQRTEDIRAYGILIKQV